MKKNNKGFTLMEMLIVVAIIGVLVAIAIPTVTANLAKSKQAADEANVRSAYAEASAGYLMGDGGTVYTAKMQANCAGDVNIGGYTFKTGVSTTNQTAKEAPAWTAGQYVKVTVDGSGAKFEAVAEIPASGSSESGGESGGEGGGEGA